MKAALLIMLALVVWLPVRAADEEARPAIRKGLDFLAREGNKWMEEKSCNSCHHLPELLWTHREARRRGFAIDDKQFTEWQQWSADHEKDTKPGVEQIAFSILAMPDAPHADAVKTVLTSRQPDGTWKPAGQFATMQKRPTAEAQLHSTRLFLLALGAGAPADPPKALDQAAAVSSLETLIFQALYETRSGKGDASPIIDRIVEARHEDGGWSWMMQEMESDALATGQVLFLLATHPGKHADAITSARKWLLAHQQSDGGWLTDITRISRIDRSKPEKANSLKAATEIYHFWGSSWAVLGLLHTLPVKE